VKRSTIIGVLALVTVASLGVATVARTRRHRVELRIAEMGRMGERASTPKFEATLVVKVDQPGGQNGRSNAATPPPAGTRGNAPSVARPDSGSLFARDPGLHSAYRQAVEGRLRQTYARLFARLNLPPGQIEKAVALLVIDAEHELDLEMSVRALRLGKDDPAAGEFRRAEKTDTEARLESVLGVRGMEAWLDYNRALGMRSTAEDVADLGLAADAPMTGEQTEELMLVLAEASGSYREGGMPEWTSTDWAEVLKQASTFLTPAQLRVLDAKSQQARAAVLLAQFYESRPRADRASPR
jgi:hypothetical protein